MVSKVHKQKPKRKCTKTYANYTSFKPYIREDFNKRCGYCDDLDLFHGGVRGYQIDHFRPHSIAKFTHLKEAYSNLIYSCPFCNRAKWHKWKENGFIDPCENLYDEHLARCGNGKLKYKSLRGKYIYENLNLYLQRHEVLWSIERIQEQKKELKTYLKKLDFKSDKYKEIINQFIIYDDEIEKYYGIYYSEI